MSSLRASRSCPKDPAAAQARANATRPGMGRFGLVVRSDVTMNLSNENSRPFRAKGRTVKTLNPRRQALRQWGCPALLRTHTRRDRHHHHTTPQRARAVPGLCREGAGRRHRAQGAGAVVRRLARNLAFDVEPDQVVAADRRQSWRARSKRTAPSPQAGLTSGARMRRLRRPKRPSCSSRSPPGATPTKPGARRCARSSSRSPKALDKQSRKSGSQRRPHLQFRAV